MSLLTAKEERFAILISEGLSQAAAYREAYDSTGKPETVQVAASKLMAKDKVRLRVEELQRALEEKSLWSRLDSVKTLAEIARGTRVPNGDGDPVEPVKDSDRVNAVKALNQMHGWDKQVIDHTSSDGSMTPKSVDADLVKSLADKLVD